MFDLFPLSDEEISARKAKREKAFRNPAVSSLAIGIAETQASIGSTTDKTKTIATLNDDLRRRLLTPGRNKVVISHTVSNMSFIKRIHLLKLISSFDDFSNSNDPNGERDFGKIKFEGESYFWKIDYYDNSMEYGSDDPSNPNITTRVLTVMHTSEY